MSKIPRSADVLVEQILLVPGLLDKVKEDPDTVLRELARQATKNLPPPALLMDSWIYRIVVGSLGAVAVIAIGGAIYLSARGPVGSPVQIPDVLTALGAAAIGALAGLLAPSPAVRPVP